MRHLAAVATLTCALLVAAGAHAQPPLCVPGTPYCASADGNSGVQLGGQVGPNGASAWGNANGNANAEGPRLRGEEWRRGGWRPPPRPASPPRRFGFGFGPSAVVRGGLRSGFKGGGSFAVSFRFASLAFEMETQLVHGGTTRATDWTFPLSFLVPLGQRRTLFEGLYLRFGGSPIGATFAKAEDGGGFVRFGVHAGAGYELRLGGVVTWRVLDARVSFDLGTKKALDRLGHEYDGGLQLGSGLTF